ncbi:MAG: S8 family serine peptidase, partial [Bacteroidaceae bacterium]|nr:S8 family serine peptidase [Bacteroidaceae bacterium]
VFFNSKDIKSDMASFAQQFKQVYPDAAYKVLYFNPAAGTMLLGVPQDRLIQTADELPQKIKGIDFYVTTNDILNGESKPSDPGFSMQWNDEYHKLIQAYEAWDITTGDRNVTVAIVDSYFDLSNPEIGQRFRNPINISTKRKNVLPPAQRPADAALAGCYSHGSHVAGLAIGGQSNALGCSGIAPNCSWIPVALGTTPWSSIAVIEGVLYAIYQGADVVNMSIGGISPDIGKLPLADQVAAATKLSKRAEAAWEFILKTADEHNCVIVKAAGNESALMGVDYMNRSKRIVTVEAVDGKGIATEFSNFGKVPEAGLNYSTVSAPGLMLWSVTPKNCIPTLLQEMKSQGINLPADGKNGFMPMMGTSMASPVVAGAVALLKSKKKDLTTDQVIKILTMTAKQTDKKHRIGPTIQIKDALDATGGELANFDDLMKDHNLLLGKWRSTYELIIENTKTKKKVDDQWTYFIFDTPTSGFIEYHGINTKRIYKAKAKVVWGENNIEIIQLGDAVSADGNTVNPCNYDCKPNKDRLLEATGHPKNSSSFNFMLEKVK